MKFKELVDDVSWEDVKQSLLKFYDMDETELLNYEITFNKLGLVEPVLNEDNMRICINWVDPVVALDDEGYWAVDGMNGTLQKETDDYEHFKDRVTEEFANSEVGYALDFTPWDRWLDMEIDEATANNVELMRSDIVALCLWEMTFHGYDEEDVQEIFEELKDRVKKIEEMPEEELKANSITLEELKERLKKLGEDVNEAGTDIEDDQD